MAKKKKLILVVDDDLMLLELYRRLFATYGMNVSVAKDGEEGLQMIIQEKPDFVILDIRMPKLDGIEVLRLIRKDEKLKRTPVLMLTNFDLEEYRKQVEQLGVVDFMVKVGIEPKQLVKRVMEFTKDMGEKLSNT